MSNPSPSVAERTERLARTGDDEFVICLSDRKIVEGGRLSRGRRSILRVTHKSSYVARSAQQSQACDKDVRHSRGELSLTGGRGWSHQEYHVHYYHCP